MFDDLFNNDAFMLGANILANNTGHYGAFAPAVGGGVQSWAQQKPDMMETAEKQAQLQHLEEYIKTLPEEQQALFRAYPSLAEKMFENQLGMGDRYGSTFYAENPQDGNRFWIYQLQKGGDPIPLMPANPKHNMMDMGPYFAYGNPYAPGRSPVIPGMSQPQGMPQGQQQGQQMPAASQYNMPSYSPQGAPSIGGPQGGMPGGAPTMGQYGPASKLPEVTETPGYMAAQTRAVETAKGETEREQKNITEQGANINKVRAAETQNDVVQDTLDMIESSVNGWTTGPLGSTMAGIPIAGRFTEATKLRDLLQTLKANIGFDKLQAMRDASPTGGALGQVSTYELENLQSVVGKLNPDQPEEMMRVLGQVRKMYDRIIHGNREWYDGKYGSGAWDSVWSKSETARTQPAGNEGDLLKRIKNAKSLDELSELERQLEDLRGR